MGLWGLAGGVVGCMAAAAAAAGRAAAAIPAWEGGGGRLAEAACAGKGGWVRPFF